MHPPSNSTALTQEKLFMRVINYLLFARTVSYSSNGSPINCSYIFQFTKIFNLFYFCCKIFLI